MGDIQEKFLPHPLAPLLNPLGMARRTESACLAGKHQQPLFPTVRAPDAGKAAHRIATVEILLYNILDDWPEIPVLLLEPILIFSKKPLKIIKEQCLPERRFFPLNCSSPPNKLFLKERIDKWSERRALRKNYQEPDKGQKNDHRDEPPQFLLPEKG